MRKDNAQGTTAGRGVLRVRRGPAGAVKAARRCAAGPWPVLLHDQVVGQAADFVQAIHVWAAAGYISNSAPALEPGKDGGLRWC